MISFFTFQDALDHGLDYLGGSPNDQTRRDCVRAATETYRDLANAFNWTYLYTHSRIITSGSFDGAANGATIAYDHTGGTYERMATITGAIWPSWAGDGCYVRVGEVAYRVDERKSATVVTFDETVNPGEDLASGTEFQLYRDTYLLPEDYIAQDQALYERNFGGMTFTHPREWLFTNRYVFAQGIPQNYTVTGDRHWPGRLVMRIFPWPAEAKSIDFIYKRRPRSLLIAQESTGRITVTLGSNAVAGTGTVFTPKMVGSVLRMSASTSKPPSSLIFSGNPNAVPIAFESIVVAYVSPTSLVLADPLDAGYSGVCFTISDPVDIEAGAMLNAYLRGIEKHLGMNRTLKDKPSAAKQYLEELANAKSADSRNFTGRSVNQHGPLRRRLRDMPYTFDIN